MTDESGNATRGGDGKPTHVFVDAADAEEAIRQVAETDGHEVLDRIHQVAGIQAMATVRHGKRAIMLHAFPAQEAEWRVADSARVR